ncbi:MAG: hypothetical protein Q8K79_06715 [Solirubrobacteraceae bacterium]|nr:hypothetical protein [Solirubrobacteraceae bacterium]
MPSLRRNKKFAVIGTICLLIAAAGAYAYWTAAGTGSVAGTASAGGTITLSGTVDPGIAPGLSKTVHFTATNATTSAITVGTISLTGVTVDAGHAGCDVGDFAMVAVASDQQVAAGASGFSLTATGELTMANTAVNQDACKGATLTLALASS